MEVKLDVNKTVKKSNSLNELRCSNAKPVEYRLFCVYLAHVPMDSEDNVVTFTLADYTKIAGLDKPRYADLKAQANNIMSMTATIEDGAGGFSVYPLFSEFKLYKDNEEWLVSLECNPKIAHMIREEKGKFIRYKLYNAIYLKSHNQQRMYEILKQYEKIGTRTVYLEDLREFLGVKKNEYPRWADFSEKVLKVCQKALKEYTDICFDYEAVKKNRKVIAVSFTIKKNETFVDKMMISKFLKEHEDDVVATYVDDEIVVNSDNLLDDESFRAKREELCAGTEDVFFDQFTYEQLAELVALAAPHIDPESIEKYRDGCESIKMCRGYATADYIRLKVLKADAAPNIENRYAYIKAAVFNNYK